MSPATAGPAGAVERFLEVSLVGLLGSGLAALASTGYLDATSLGLAVAGCLLRLLRVSGWLQREFSWKWLAGLAAVGLAGIGLENAFRATPWPVAALRLGFLAAGLAVVAARPGRDDIWLALGALGALLAASWWSTNLYFVGALAAFLLCGVAAFSSAELRRPAGRQVHVVGTPGPQLAWRLAVLSVLLGAGILLLTAAFFFVLPRTAQAAFRRLAPERFRVAGFSDQVTLGHFGRLGQHQAPLLRVRFHDGAPAGLLKWRGSALERFDGRRWWTPEEGGERLEATDGLVKVADNRQLWRAGRRILYEVRLGALASGALYLAGTPEFLRIGAPAVVRSASGGYKVGTGSAEGLRYGASAFLEAPGLPEAGGVAAAAPPACCLELPRLDPRIGELAQRLTGGLATAEARAEAVADYLRHGYTYSTRSAADRAADPLADFLLRSRRGHCEYFASAMAVLLRAGGIRARVVTGFQSGIHNPVSGWEVMRAADAHSWVEAWIPGRGWTSYDPTPPRPARAMPSAWTRLGWYVDAAETFWDEWVLGYDLNRQLVLAARMESSGRDLSARWRDRLRARAGQLQATASGWARRYGLALLAALAAAAAAWATGTRMSSWRQNRRRRRRAARGLAEASDATLLYQQMLGLLARRGFPKPAWETPAAFARQLPASPLAELVVQFTGSYNELRFGARRPAAARMAALLERLRSAAA